MNRKLITQTRISALLFFTFVLSSSLALAQDKQININKAESQLLNELPFVGSAKAKAIVHCREKMDGFLSLKDLKRCPEIDTITYEAIQPYLTVKGSGEKIPEVSYKHATSSSQDKPSIIRTINGVITLPNKAYYKTLMHYIRFAEKRIDLSIFLFKATKSPKNKPALLAKALIAAKKRGLSVSVIMENSGYDAKLNEENQRVANQLQRKGIRIRFDSSKTTTHTKIAVIDNRFCFVGSHNYSHSSLSYNNEFSLLIDSKEMASNLLRYMQDIVE